MTNDLRWLYTDPPRSFAGDYPEVPPPEPLLSPLILAAHWVGRELYGEDMPAIAADLLEAGFDTHALRRLSGEILVNGSAGIEELVGRVFRELGIRYPLRESEPEFIATKQLAREVIAGHRNAWAAASHLEIVIYRWVPVNAYLQTIFGINDEVDWEPTHRRGVQVLNDALIGTFARLAMLSFEEFQAAANMDMVNSKVLAENAVPQRLKPKSEG